MHSSTAPTRDHRDNRPSSAPATGSHDEGAHLDRAPGGRRRSHTRRRFLLGGATALGLAVTGTSAWALNRFVVDHVEVSDVAAYEAANAAVTPAATQAATDIQVTGTSYSSSRTTITIEQVTTGSGAQALTYYTADIRLTDATALRSAFANNEFGTNITAKPTRIATEHDAVLAINGDYYGFRSDGILIRNGVVYRDQGVREGLAIYADGRMEVYDETTTSAQALLDAGVWSTCSFGPALVRDGAVLEGIESVEVDTNVGNHSIQGEQPRTAIGLVEDHHYVFVVVDGRSEGYSRGVTMTELARIMTDLGCTTAYNLDGGGSSAMYFNGAIINQPSNDGERATSDILYIANGA
ncbi:phosphodiester glycosidase family protein [Actinomyces capricornis]|uniref:Exopolysaccharide biosynthesis protein n=1 Tax=Actinomyces capricornis TaxID=2755559 RepID=A0ABN6K7S3_9ACTO|nr:phosphodiester glycosidase family protein [Actinomyces capricornis]BDA64065.1 exopolysaccharide biosynthesis protein [Actinomyces capricornis]